MTVLKKYSNRRLYDTEKSAYVTLGQVEEMVRLGREVKVIDAGTGEDVTAFILTQIVLEEARKKNALLPTPLLVLLIRYGDNLLQEFFNKYLEQTVQAYLSYRGEVDLQFGKWLELGKDFSDMARKAMTGLDPFHSIFRKKDAEPDGSDTPDDHQT